MNDIIDYNNFVIDDKIISLNALNLLYGKNGSGKTLLLNKLSDVFKSPIFNLNSDSSFYNKFENTILFKQFYKVLTGRDEIVNISNLDRIYYWLCIALVYGYLEENIVLLDNMCWGSIDLVNKINIIDNLDKLSCYRPLVMTACQEDVKSLVKKKNNINIIDL